MLPVVLVLAIVLSAPFIGLVRDYLFDRFQAAAVRNLALAFLAIAAVAFLYAIARIRERRMLRFAGLALTAALLWLEGVILGRGGIADTGIAAQVSVAERIHLVEYGLLVYLLYRACKPAGDLSMLVLPLLGVTLAGVLDEGMQWFVETRVGEIRDVLLNFYAGVCGLLFSLSLEPPRDLVWRLGEPGRRRVASAVAITVLALGAFFSTAHLGHEHEDPEIGRFRSWHDLEELSQATADRAKAWQSDPPTGLSPWRREDLYLTEASWHANHRNERYAAGDFYMAAQANRILEKYYGPFLDLESFRGSGVHRYPPEVKRDLEARAPQRDPRTYLSPVILYRVYPWPPKPLFFAALVPAVLLLWGLPRWLRKRAG